MAEARTLKLKGGSGTEYTYEIHTIGTTFKDIPGNYVFMKETEAETWTVLYIGETGSLADRLNDPDSHHKIECVRDEGGEHLGTHASSADEGERKKEEDDLLATRSPACQG